MGLVYALVGRYRDRGEAREDLIQVATLGLLCALEKYDPSRGFRFSTYAIPVIDGKLRDYFRASGTVHVSRALKQNAAKLSRASAELGQDAPLLQLAAAAGLSAEEAALAFAAMRPVKSLQELSEEGMEPQAAEDGYERVLDKLCLSEALAALPREDAALIRLRYFHALTQSQTARVLKMTQVQVSRAEKRILAKLRELLS